MTRKDKAIEFFENHFNCSQSVFAAFAADLNLPEDTCLKIATPFGAGISRQQLTCGAVTGALMVLGMHFGKGCQDADEKKQETYNKTLEFVERFRGKNGSISCRDLLEGLNMNNPEEYALIQDRNMFTTHCKVFVTDAVSIVEKITNPFEFITLEDEEKQRLSESGRFSLFLRVFHCIDWNHRRLGQYPGPNRGGFHLYRPG